MSEAFAIHLTQAPYPGLRPFQTEETDIFFGRERQTDDLLRRLSQTHFLPVIGPSGCGKSSLVRAGLLASIETGFIAEAGGRWRVLAMMPRDRPIEQLANALDAAAPESPKARNSIALQAILRSGPRGLIEALKECGTVSRENVLLFVDQFEEIFRFGERRSVGDSTNGSDIHCRRRKDEADAFVTLLLETARDHAAYVVLTMRSDFLRDCSAFAGLPEAFNKSIYLTPRLDRDEIQAAIEEPARVFGGNLKPELVRELINDADNNQDQLPLMQHVLMRMWSKAASERPSEPPVLTLADYAAVGEISKALCQDAEAAFEKELKPEEQKIAEVMFRALCVRGSSDRDTRAPARLDHIARVAGVKWEDVVPVVEVFRTAGRYFLTPQTGKLNPDTVLDISHESLIRNWKRLQAWVEDEALAAGIYQRLERDAQEWKQGGDVLSPGRLAAVNAWEKRFQPTEAWAQRYGGSFGLAMEFLKASRAQREEEARQAEIATRQKKLNKGLAIALVVALGLIGWAVYQTWQASKETDRAEHYLGQALMYRALAEWNSDKPLSALLPAVAASNYDKKIDPIAAINDPFLPRVHYYRQIRHPAEVSALAIHPKGTLLAVALRDGCVDLVNPQTGAIDKLPSTKKQGALPDSASVQLAFSAQGDRLFCADGGNELRTWSVADGKLRPLENHLLGKAITGFAVAQSGAVALSFADGSLEIRDGKTTLDALKDQLPSYSGRSASDNIDNSSPVRSLVFSPDEQLVAGIVDEKVRVWQIENSKLEPVDVVDDESLSVGAVGFSADGAKLFVATREGSVSLSPLELSRTKGSAQSRSKAQRPKPKGLGTWITAGSSQDEKPRKLVLTLSFTESAPRMRDDFDLRAPNGPTGGKLDIANGRVGVSVAVDPDAEWLYWLAGDGYLRAWSPTGRTQFVKTHERTAASIAISPSGSWLATGGTDTAGKGTTRIWRLETKVSTAEAAKDTLPPIRWISVNPSGKIIAIGRDDYGARIWQGETIQVFPRSESDEELYLSDDGERVAASSNGKVRFFDVATRSTTSTIDLEMNIYAFNGPTFAAEESSTSVGFWDATTGTRRGDFAAAKEQIADIMFGRELIAVAADRNQITIWDIKDPSHVQKRVTMSTEATPVRSIAFAPAENLLAATCGKETIELFDAKSGRRTGSIDFAESTPIAARFNSGGTLLAVGMENGTIQVWDCSRQQKVGEVRGWDSNGITFAFTPRDELVAAMSNKTIGVWSSTGTLTKTVSKDWRPRDADDAMRLSGLALDGFDVRPLTPEEEQRLNIDANSPLENVALAEYWSAYRTTVRNLAVLKNKRDITASDVDEADLLASWIDKYREAPAHEASVRIAVEDRDALRIKFGGNYGNVGTEALLQGDYGRAISVFEEVLKIIPERKASGFLAGRGFARFCKGDIPGANADLEAYKAKPANVRSWEYVLRRYTLTPEQSAIASSFLIWLDAKYKNPYGLRAKAYFVLKKYSDALTDVNEALSQVEAATPAAAPEMSQNTASLLVLRGRILDAQGSTDARNDWQQVVERFATKGYTRASEGYTRASAQMLLGKFDPAHFEAARAFFEEVASKNSTSAIHQYNLGCFYAVRAASQGSDVEGQRRRGEDLDKAIEALRNGVRLRSSPLQQFRTWETDLQSLDNDPRLKKLLLEEEKDILATEEPAD